MRLASLSCFSLSSTMVAPSRNSSDVLLVLLAGVLGAAEEGVVVVELRRLARRVAADGEPPPPPRVPPPPSSLAAEGVRGVEADAFTGVLFHAGFGVAVDAALRAFCHFLLAFVMGEVYGEAAARGVVVVNLSLLL